MRAEIKRALIEGLTIGLNNAAAEKFRQVSGCRLKREHLIEWVDNLEGAANELLDVIENREKARE